MSEHLHGLGELRRRDVHRTPYNFVAKLDPSGAHVWSESFANAQQTEYGNGLALDAAGNVFVTGDFTGSIDLGEGEPTGETWEPMTCSSGKLDPGGGYLWSKRFTGNNEYATIRRRDGHFPGNVVFTGTLSDRRLSTSAVGTLTPTGNDLFIAKFDPGGAHMWSESFPGGGEAYPQGMAVDAVGNVYVACSFCGSVDLGGTTLMGWGTPGPEEPVPPPAHSLRASTSMGATDGRRTSVTSTRARPLPGLASISAAP